MFYFPCAVCETGYPQLYVIISSSILCPYARTCYYYFNSFVPRTVRLWDTLPTPIVNSPSIIVNDPTTSMYS